MNTDKRNRISVISVISILSLLFFAGCQSSDAAIVAPTLTPSPAPMPETTRVMPTATMAAVQTAVVPLTLIPLPTPTASPTATPIAYTVQAGDTLLAIAINHQTTTEAIEVLNPEVDARLLSIGQTIILPSPDAPIAPLVGAVGIDDAPPIQAEIGNITSYGTPLDGVWLFGEVENRGELPIANVQVEALFLTATGEVGAAQTTWIATAVISPNQTAPFAMLFPQQVEGSPVISIIGGERLDDLGDHYLELTAIDTTLEIMEDGVLINGRLHNSGTLTATRISLTTTFYDADGAITGYDYRLLADEMLPETCRTCAGVSFTFTAVPPGGNTTNFTITAQGKAR